MFYNFQNIDLFLFLFWLVSGLFDYCEYIYLWQLKEYRLDRISDFLSSAQGKKFIYSYKIILRPLLFVMLIFGQSYFFIGLKVVLLSIFSLDLLESFSKFIKQGFRRPKITLKTATITTLALIAEIIIFIGATKVAPLLLLIASRFALCSLIILALNLPVNFVKNIYIKKAAKKLARYKQITIIGITGSYGKTTVKNFLEQILNKKFVVKKTSKNINTDIGIAKFILAADFSQTDILLVEMAAYTIGEIKLICSMVKPKIGILTAINEQHLQLFGNIKNTQTAKYELLRSLPESGLAIVNNDNYYCREHLGELKCKVETYGQKQDFHPDYLINDIEYNQSSFDFSITNKEESYFQKLQINTNLAGCHNVMNVAPAIIAAGYLGLSAEEIIKQSLALHLPDDILQIKKYGKSIIIDDSYNSNPEGFKAALDFLSNYQTAGKKIIISRGMLELGDASANLHRRIGRHIGEIAQELIIISPDAESALRSGASESNLEIKTIFSAQGLLDYFKLMKNENNVVLLENRVPELIKKEINNANI